MSRDEAVYAELVEPHRAELRAHCQRMLGSIDDAEDALQEAMLRAWRGLPSFEGRSSLGAVGTKVGNASPDGRYEQRESIELSLIAALQPLPASQLAVLVLRDVLGFTARETADLLQTTVAAVNGALQRARATLEEELPERSPEDIPRILRDERQRDLVERYLEAWERDDIDTLVSMLVEGSPRSGWRLIEPGATPTTRLKARAKAASER